MKTLLIGGNFAENIRESGFIRKLHTELQTHTQLDVDYKNGGTFEELAEYIDRLGKYEFILWFVNVPNKYEKLVRNIKAKNQKAMLVTSKNNLDGKYSEQELIGRVLQVKANLCLIFTRSSDLVETTVIDPLGNKFTDKSTSIADVATVVVNRAIELAKFTRAGSTKVGEKLEVPNEEKFFAKAREFADKFHELIHPGDTPRFLGNLSFRCDKGFPSFRAGGLIFVTRRNIDKRLINKEGFVAVEAQAEEDGSVNYYGNFKPSVDTPVQVRLYEYYENVNFMVHSHVYIKGAPYTDSKVPCGALEEVESIIKALPDKGSVNVAVNLLGHGSIVMTNNVDFFDNIEYVARNFFED